MPKSVLFSFLALFALTCGAQDMNPDEENLHITLEEPAEGAAKSGVSNLRGFALTKLSDVPIARVEVYVDGTFATRLEVGGLRGDVCTVFPESEWPNCAESGYSMALNYSGLSPGEHTILVRVVDVDGFFRDASSTFTVARFEDRFISDPTQMDFVAAEVSIQPGGSGLDKRIFLRNVFVEDEADSSDIGDCYDVTLDWKTATQGWEIVDITKINDDNCTP